jgi:hypothetical protein
MHVDTRIQGIPCQVYVTHYVSQAPMGRWADSDVDCYGYTEVEYDVLDRRGRRADWLAKKITDADEARILKDIEAARYEDYD